MLFSIGNARVRRVTPTPETLKFLRVWANYRRMRRIEDCVWKCFHKCRNGCFCDSNSLRNLHLEHLFPLFWYSLCASLTFHNWRCLPLPFRWRRWRVQMKADTLHWLGLSHCTSCLLRQIWKNGASITRRRGCCWQSKGPSPKPNCLPIFYSYLFFFLISLKAQNRNTIHKFVYLLNTRRQNYILTKNDNQTFKKTGRYCMHTCINSKHEARVCGKTMERI